MLILDKENTLVDLDRRYNNVEKVKQHLLTEVHELEMQLDQSNQKSNQLEKRTQNLEKSIVDWKAKSDELKKEVDSYKKKQG